MHPPLVTPPNARTIYVDVPCRPFMIEGRQGIIIGDIVKEEQSVNNGLSQLLPDGLLTIFGSISAPGTRLSNHITHPSRYIEQDGITVSR
jgi:hypothetical protein